MFFLSSFCNIKREEQTDKKDPVTLLNLFSETDKEMGNGQEIHKRMFTRVNGSHIMFID